MGGYQDSEEILGQDLGESRDPGTGAHHLGLLLSWRHLSILKETGLIIWTFGEQFWQSLVARVKDVQVKDLPSDMLMNILSVSRDRGCTLGIRVNQK